MRDCACADWGGGIAWGVAAWYPQVVEKLVVMAAPHKELFLKNMDAAQKKKCVTINIMLTVPGRAIRS